MESPAANGIAGFMFSEMHVKEQGLVKLRSNFAFTARFLATQSELSQSGSCGGSATLFRSHLAIPHPFGSIQPWATGIDWSSMTLLLKGAPVMFVSVYLTCNTGIAGENFQKLSEIGSCVTNAGIPFVIAGVEISCTSGRLIDKSFVEGPSTLPRSPRRYLTRSLTTSSMKFPAIDRNAGFSPVSDCVKLSESLHFRPPYRSHPGYLSKCETEASDRGRLLGRGFETFFFASNQLPSASLLERNTSLIVVFGPVCFLA